MRDGIEGGAAGDAAGRRAHDVFISYSTHDVATADDVCRELEAHGVRCWIAPRDVPLGTTWKASIVEAIRGAHAMVLVFSGHANDSTQVKREVDIAFESRPQIPIFVFRVENARMSDELTWCVGGSHSLDAVSPPLSAHTTRLAKALVAAGYASASASASASVPVDGAAAAVPAGDATAAPERDADDAFPNTDPPHAAIDEPPPTRSRAVWLATLVCGALAIGALILFGVTRRDAVASRGASVAPAHAADSQPAGRQPGAAAPATGGPPASALQADTAIARERTPSAGRAATTRPAGGGDSVVRAPVARAQTDSAKAQCAKLLERVSLGDALDPQESAWLRRNCRGP